jgi:hypothetical protein
MNSEPTHVIDSWLFQNAFGTKGKVGAASKTLIIVGALDVFDR